MLIPATWATKDTGLKTRNGYPIFELNPEFVKGWLYIQDQDVFIHRSAPIRHFKSDHLNRIVAPFAHRGANVEKLLSEKVRSVIMLTFAPDKIIGVITVKGTGQALNQYRPSLIKGREGDISKFETFTRHIIPSEEDCYQLKRWIATLIACPERRMTFSLLLYSMEFGVGKNTLTDAVLAPLVGPHNCSWPNESMIINSDFNAWLVNKRLVIVSEVYSGHGMRMFNRFKTYISDQDIEARMMYMNPYHTDNWAHFALLTNHHRAVILPNDNERRWLVPGVTENKLPLTEATEFRLWLKTGGLEAIANWAAGFKDYIKEGEEAPLTVAKTALVEAQLSQHMQEAKGLALELSNLKKPNAFACKEVWHHLLNLKKLAISFLSCLPEGKWSRRSLAILGAWMVLHPPSDFLLPPSCSIFFRFKFLNS
jgi:hypothetical protein